jgi:predicted membrane-bound spermidine synthase
MAGQLAGLFSKTNVETLKNMLSWGSFGILFGLLALIALRVLNVLGKNTMVLACLAGYNVVFILAASICFKGDSAGVLTLVYASVISVCVLGVSAVGLVFGYLRCRTDLLRMVALPGACACVAGLLCFLLGKVLTPHLGNGATLLVTFVLALAVYWMGNLLLRVFGRQELNMVP